MARKTLDSGAATSQPVPGSSPGQVLSLTKGRDGEHWVQRKNEGLLVHVLVTRHLLPAKLLIALATAALALPAHIVQAEPTQSICYGTPEDGSLEHGVRLPRTGSNFEAYSSVGWLAGRTYVHSRVHSVLIQAFSALETSAPGKVFVYGETGWASGGRIRPHKTHRNGTSVDLMVPVLRDGRSVPLPGSAFNRYGYDIAFDDNGIYGQYQIDWEALGQWIHELHRAARREGIGIRRIIFEVPLQKHLLASSRGSYLKEHIAFSTKQAWVRHDDHIHVDFSVPCLPMPSS
jgi:penicillin-insensitive murein DD-endopeptidase